MAQTHTEAYTHMQNECTQLGRPLHFTDTLLKVIKVTLEGASPPTFTEHGPLSEVIVSQASIGYYRVVI